MKTLFEKMRDNRAKLIKAAKPKTYPQTSPYGLQALSSGLTAEQMNVVGECRRMVDDLLRSARYDGCNR